MAAPFKRCGRYAGVCVIVNRLTCLLYPLWVRLAFCSLVTCGSATVVTLVACFGSRKTAFFKLWRPDRKPPPATLKGSAQFFYLPAKCSPYIFEIILLTLPTEPGGLTFAPVITTELCDQLTRRRGAGEPAWERTNTTKVQERNGLCKHFIIYFDCQHRNYCNVQAMNKLQ